MHTKRFALSFSIYAGILGNYTQRTYLDACPYAMYLWEDTYKKSWKPYQFTDIVILTDGTCGSACSTFVSKLMTHPYVCLLPI